MDRNKLVEDNYGLVGGFLQTNFAKCRKLTYDNHSGILHEAIYKASETYNPKRGAFSTYAYTFMKKKILSDFHSQKYDKRKANYKSQELKQEYMGGQLDVGISKLECYDYLQSVLTPYHFSIIKKLLLNETQEEIAEAFGCSQQNIQLEIKKIRKILEPHKQILIN